VGVRDAEPELDGATFGRLLHGVLSATYRDLIGGGDVPLRPDNLDAALEIAHRRARLAVESSDCPGTAAERRLAAWRIKKLITRLLSSESKVESNLVPSETEVCVGLHGGVDVGGLCIHGRIDRIDRIDRADGPDRADADADGDLAATLFVVDYKSGEAPKASQLGAEAGLQVPLYVLALAAKYPEAQVVGGAYVSLADGRAVGMARGAGFGPVLGSWGESCKTLSLDEAAVFFGAAVTTASRAAAGMRAGEIPPASTASGCPFYCSFGPICRSQRKGYRR
jgi:RecB family exonuclease